MQMTPTPTVRSSAVITDGCRISYHVNCAAEVTVSFGTANGMLELTFHADALGEFVRQGSDALDEVEARYAAIRAQAC